MVVNNHHCDLASVHPCREPGSACPRRFLANAINSSLRACKVGENRSSSPLGPYTPKPIEIGVQFNSWTKTSNNVRPELFSTVFEERIHINPLNSLDYLGATLTAHHRSHRYSTVGKKYLIQDFHRESKQENCPIALEFPWKSWRAPATKRLKAFPRIEHTPCRARRAVAINAKRSNVSHDGLSRSAAHSSGFQ